MRARASQRVLYVYMPGIKEMVRVIVNASALSGEKNPNSKLGLFDYVDKLNEEGSYIHEQLTEFSSVERTDPNPRKSYHAMTSRFSRLPSRTTAIRSSS